tara:strand:- start:2407 stop:2634 length:228 start_codon:yes stop_codon:yes gene_type:complete
MSFLILVFIVFMMVIFLNNCVEKYINYGDQINKIKSSEQVNQMRNYRNNEFNYSIDVLEEKDIPEPVNSTFFSKV